MLINLDLFVRNVENRPNFSGLLAERLILNDRASLERQLLLMEALRLIFKDLLAHILVKILQIHIINLGSYYSQSRQLLEYYYFRGIKFEQLGRWMKFNLEGELFRI